MNSIKDLKKEIKKCDESGHNEDYRNELYARINSLKEVLKSMEKMELKEGDWCDAWMELKEKING